MARTSDAGMLVGGAGGRHASSSSGVSALSHVTTVNGNDSGARVVVVQGSSRGLGLEFVRNLLENEEQNPHLRVVATTRHGEAKITPQLHDLLARHSNRLSVMRLDVELPETIDESLIWSKLVMVTSTFCSMYLVYFTR